MRQGVREPRAGATGCRAGSRSPRVVASLLAALLAACATPPRSPAPVAPEATTAAEISALAAAAASELWPVSGRYYRTTSADIYLGNLDARIASLEAQVAAGHRDRVETLAAQRYHRYRIGGRLEDAERAGELLHEHAERDWLTPAGMLLHAITLSGMHRFDEADAWLGRAADAGADAEAVRDARADLMVARGDYRGLAGDLAVSAEPAADFYALAHRADLRLLQGDLAGAESHYLAAQTLYRDSNPVPLAWLHTQMGIAFLRHGRIEDARRFFAAAVDRLPGYYLAEEHLAECEMLVGELDAARARYQRVIEQTGNPEFIAALAALEAEAGNEEWAQALGSEARIGYERLLSRHPAGYAQHAAEFFLESGDPQRAYALAAQNAELRSDIGSLILLATTAAAADHWETACAARGAALATGMSPPEIGELEPLEARCTAPTP